MSRFSAKPRMAADTPAREAFAELQTFSTGRTRAPAGFEAVSELEASHPDFASLSPSAEVMARYFFQEVKRGMGEDGRFLKRVRVWEAPGCSATYSE